MRPTVNQPNGTAGAGVTVDKGVVLAVVCLAFFVTALMGSSTNIALPTIGHEFGADAITLSWVVDAYLLALAMVLVPMGKLADIHGRKRIFQLGAVAWTLTSLLCSLGASAAMLVGFRALQGIAAAMISSTSMAIVTSVYPPKERGRAVGTATAAVYVGLSLGPFVGGVMTQQLGWRSMFVLSAVLGAAAVAVTAWKLKGEWTGIRNQRLDVVGSVIFGLALLAILYGFSVLPDPLGAWLILASILLLAAFVWWENQATSPVLDIRLFRHNVVFAMSNLAALINYAASFAIAFLLSLYLQYVKGLDPQSAGLVLLAQPVVMAVLSPFAGRLSDRIEPRLVASAGMAITAIGLAMIGFLDDASTLSYVVVSLVVVGLGFALFSSPNTNAVMGSVEGAYLGVASATLSAMRTVGQTLSMGVATLILALYVGSTAVTPANHASFAAGFRLAFIIFPVLCVLGIFASLARGTVHAQKPPLGRSRVTDSSPAGSE
jgi:EmrB/QacA subfamily drug resistance transporter